MAKIKTGYFKLMMTPKELDALNEATPHIAREIRKTLTELEYSSLDLSVFSDSIYRTVDCPKHIVNRYLDNISIGQRKLFMRFLIELTLHRLNTKKKNKDSELLDSIKI